MSHEMLPELEEYIRRTGINPHALARSAGCGSSLIYQMREGKQPKPATIQKLREFLDGMRHVPEAKYNRQSERIDLSALTRVDRRPCYNCGVRADIGCEHFPKEIEA